MTTLRPMSVSGAYASAMPATNLPHFVAYVDFQTQEPICAFHPLGDLHLANPQFNLGEIVDGDRRRFSWRSRLDGSHCTDGSSRRERGWSLGGHTFCQISHSDGCGLLILGRRRRRYGTGGRARSHSSLRNGG